MRRPDDLIRASEVGMYAFCARAWWLQMIQEVSSRNVAAMQAGIRRHEEHGQQVARVGQLQLAGYALLALAILLLIAAILLLIAGIWRYV